MKRSQSRVVPTFKVCQPRYFLPQSFVLLHDTLYGISRRVYNSHNAIWHPNIGYTKCYHWILYQQFMEDWSSWKFKILDGAKIAFSLNVLKFKIWILTRFKVKVETLFTNKAMVLFNSLLKLLAGTGGPNSQWRIWENTDMVCISWIKQEVKIWNWDGLWCHK